MYLIFSSLKANRFLLIETLTLYAAVFIYNNQQIALERQQ